jgi:hypothetical protein
LTNFYFRRPPVKRKRSSINAGGAGIGVSASNGANFHTPITYLKGGVGGKDVLRTVTLTGGGDNILWPA